MGREIKRVALDFDWPLGEVWKGFVSPEWEKCAACGGQGDTAARQWVEKIAHLLMMLGEAGAKGRLHPWLANLPLGLDRPPSPDIVELTTGLAGRPPSSFGHDALDRWAAARKITAAAGLDPEKWGMCRACGGHGYASDYIHAQSEAWEPTEPPAGEGWQIWETVSEGSPLTPVFATPKELAAWCELNKPWRTIMTAAEWMKFIEAGWAPSGVISAATGVVEGAVAIGKGML